MATEMSFIEDVEYTRGKIKSAAHHDMLKDIFKHGTTETQEEASVRKRLGIKVISAIAAMSKTKQKEFFLEFNSGFIQDATTAKLLITDLGGTL